MTGASKFRKVRCLSPAPGHTNAIVETLTRPRSCAPSEFNDDTPGLGDRIFPEKVGDVQREVLDSCVQLLMDGGKEKLDQLERERRKTQAAGEQGDGGQDDNFDARLRALHDVSQGG